MPGPHRLCRSLALPCVAVLSLAAGCSDSDDGLANQDSDSPATSASEPSGGSGGPDDSGGDPSDSGLTSDSGGTGASSAGDEGIPGDSGDSEGPAPQPGQLTAGAWRDLDHWQFWLDLLQQQAWQSMPEYWGFATHQRFAVTVEADGKTVADASVTLLAADVPVWSARTDVHGEAELFAGMFAEAEGPFALKVTSAGQTTTIEAIEPAGATKIPVELPARDEPGQVLDLMFVIDTTGSMGDELSYLQAELGDVIDRVRQEVGANYTLRLSVNFYRDSGDEYVVRSFPFTEDIDQAIDELNAQEALGGGDWPEAVDAALIDAINDHAWSESATSRLCFLVIDAPPHYKTAALETVRTSIQDAAAKGVRVIPLAASGTDKNLEFLLRFMAVATGGTYTFLTNHSGIGDSHIEPTIGEYQVEFLNDMLVRLISQSVVQP